MISRRYRFHGYGSLRFVYRSGQTTRGPWFAVKSLPNPKRRNWRLAIVVSRKVNKSAVARNRIRRRLYEAARELGASIETPHDIVVTVFHDSLAEEPYKKVFSQLKKQFRQAGIIK